MTNDMVALERTRDALGAALRYRQNASGTWVGPCPACGARDAWVWKGGLACACGTMEMVDAIKLYAPELLSQARKGRAVTVLLSDVEPVSVSWLWPGHIPLGRLTILDGDPGLGKSTLTLDLAARITTHREMPDRSLGLSGPRGVVLLGAEDGLADTVRPRLDAAGANVAKVTALAAVQQPVQDDARTRERRLPTIYDVDAISEAAREVDAVLLVVDPLAAYMAGADTHRDSDVRQALGGLAALAERTRLAVLAVRHLTKGTGGNPLYRGGGSIAFIAAARSGMLLARDPELGDRLVLATTKSNLAPTWPSLALRIATRDDVPRVEWLGESKRTAAELLAEPADPEDRTALGEAVAWLRDEALADGPRSARRIVQEAGSLGIAERTLRRARIRLGVKVRQERGPDGRVLCWVWAAPSQVATGEEC